MTKRDTMFLLHTLLFIMQLITIPVTFKTASVAAVVTAVRWQR